MDEKRRIERSHLIHYLRVFDDISSQCVGNLVDISPKGIKLISEKPVEIDKLYHFHMEFPERLMGKMRVDYDAVSVWCNVDADVDPNLYTVGFQIKKITKEDVEIIEFLIANYKDE